MSIHTFIHLINVLTIFLNEILWKHWSKHKINNHLVKYDHSFQKHYILLQ